MRDYPLSKYIDELTETNSLLIRLSADAGVELSADGSKRVMSWESQLPAPYAKFVPSPSHADHVGHVGKAGKQAGGREKRMKYMCACQCVCFSTCMAVCMQMCSMYR
jgi:hypothetical protein